MNWNPYQRYFLDAQRAADRKYIGETTIATLDKHWDDLYAELKDHLRLDNTTVATVLQKYNITTVGLSVFCVYYRLKTGINFRFRSDYQVAYLFL
jgi:hypothetical protein